MNKELLKIAFEWLDSNKWFQSSNDRWYQCTDGAGDGITTNHLIKLFKEYYKKNYLT